MQNPRDASGRRASGFLNFCVTYGRSSASNGADDNDKAWGMQVRMHRIIASDWHEGEAPETSPPACRPHPE